MFNASVTPSRVCELKFLMGAANFMALAVTSSRVCELKYMRQDKEQANFLGHILTGV